MGGCCTKKKKSTTIIQPDQEAVSKRVTHDDVTIDKQDVTTNAILNESMKQNIRY